MVGWVRGRRDGGEKREQKGDEKEHGGQEAETTCSKMRSLLMAGGSMSERCSR